MRKRVMQAVAIALAYIMLMGVVPFNKIRIDAKAEINVPSYLRVENGYVNNQYIYKDKTYIDIDNNGMYYNGQIGEKTNGVNSYGDLSKTEVVITVGDDYTEQKIFNLESGKITGSWKPITMEFINRMAKISRGILLP